jgi:hypothetical protein
VWSDHVIVWFMPSMFGDVDPATDDASGAWIAERLHPFARDVGSIVPPGFSQYAQIRHQSADDAESVAGYPPIELLELFANLGASHTSTPDRCSFALWDGRGWLTSQRMYWVRGGKGPLARIVGRRQLRGQRRRDAARRRLVENELGSIPRLALPQRTYLLFVGSVASATALRNPMWPSGASEPPNLWWPADQAWCVASEIDLPVTYVGGASDLIEAVLREVGELAARVTTDDKIFGHK